MRCDQKILEKMIVAEVLVFVSFGLLHLCWSAAAQPCGAEDVFEKCGRKEFERLNIDPANVENVEGFCSELPKVVMDCSKTAFLDCNPAPEL